MGKVKKILVTGGAGFVGSNLCRRLLNDGHIVYCYDNFITGKMENIADLLSHKNFHLSVKDIVSGIDGAFDCIYNLACPASPIQYQKVPIQTFTASVWGVGKLLHYLSNNKKVPMVHASTSEIYGNPLVHPQPEEYRGHVNPMGPRSCYDEGKRAAETMCYDYNRLYNTKAKVVRIFNTYGPYMSPDDGRVVSNFICQAIRGEDITIYGDGSQTRSFQYIDDLIDGLIAMMDSDELGPINIGSQSELTVKQLAEKIIELTGSKSKIIYTDLPVDDPENRRADTKRAKELLGWETKVQLEDGLKNTIEYFKKVLQ